MNNEINLSNNPKNDVELNENVLNSINLLVEAAKKTPRKEEISKLEEEIQELETAKEQYSQELAEEFEMDKKNLNDKVLTVKKVVNQKIGLYRTNIESMSKKLEEYEQDVKEQEAKLEEEKRQLENIEKLPKTRENMLKKAELEWGIIAYQEYLEFMYGEMDELQSSIIERKEKIRRIKEKAHEELDRDVQRFNSKYNIEYGNTNPTYTNSVLLVKMNEILKEKHEELEFYQKDPEEVGNEITEAMKNGEDPEIIREKLGSLTSLIGGKVNGIVDLEGAKSLDEQFNILQTEKTTVEERINENNYVMEDAFAHDQELIKKYIEDLEIYNLELIKLEEKLELHEKQRDLPKKKRELKDKTKIIKDTQKQQERMEKYSKAKSREFARMVDALTKENEQLEAEINELEAKPKVAFTGEIKREIADYKKRIETCKNKKLELTQKTEEDYIDLERKEQDLELLAAINEDIEILNERKQALNEHDPYDVAENILEEYKNDLKKNQPEEILTFHDAKDMLIEKIKSSQFAMKAVSAISNISSFFKKKTQKEEFDYDQMIDNVSDVVKEEEKYPEIEPEYNVDETYEVEESYENTLEETNDAVRTR